MEQLKDLSAQLAPHSLSGIFDDAFDLYKRHFKTLALTAALIFIPTQILLYAASNCWLTPAVTHLDSAKDPADYLLILLVILGGMLIGSPEHGIPGLIGVMVMILISAPICAVVAEGVRGQKLSIGNAFRRWLPLAPRMLAVWTLALLATLTLLIAASFVALLLASMLQLVVAPTLGPVFGAVIFFAGMIGAYVVTMALAARYFLFATQLVVLENATFTSVWDRNWQLVGKSRFRRTWMAAVFLPVIVLGLQYLMLFSLSDLVVTYIASPLFRFLVSVTINALVVLFFLPYPMIFTTLLYFDYRFRQEGLDIYLLAHSLTASAPEAARTFESPVPQGPAPLTPGRPGASRSLSK